MKLNIGNRGSITKASSNLEEDQNHIRKRIRDIVDGKAITILMSFFTVFALFGSDIRLWLTDKPADPYFFIGFIAMLVMFTLEILIDCMVVDDYKYSFFFWLDIIATVSLVPDIDWLVNPMLELFGFSSFNESADVSLSNSGDGFMSTSQASRVLKSFRLIRLIRIVKLYRYCVTSNKTEASTMLSEEQKNAQDAQQAALKKEMDPGRLGKALSDSTTKKVLVGVLAMFIIYPILSYSESDNSIYYGLGQLFWFGRSNCDQINGEFYCEDEWITSDGWNSMLKMFIEASKEKGSDTIRREILWIRVPDFSQNGRINDILTIPEEDNSAQTYWEQETRCSGNIVSTSDDCPYRIAEMELYSYTPEECSSGTVKGCSNLVSYVRVNAKSISQKKSFRNFLSIIFTTILLFMAAILISNDTQKIIIAPISKMVNIIKTLADDPLHVPSLEKEEEPNPKHMKTTLLENNIYKIANLIQMGFGRLGAQIVSNYKMFGDGILDVMIRGQKIEVIFVVCRISDFMETTECLQEEIMVFLNQISLIVHECAHLWGGFANKNFGEIYLLSWKLSNCDENENEDSHAFSDDKSEIANKALISVIKIVSEIRRSDRVNAYTKHPKIKAKFSSKFKPYVTFAIHSGWAIEGVMGTHYKMDASYFSPHLDYTTRLESLCSEYEIPIIISENAYNLFSLKAKNTLRKIDVVVTNEFKDPKGLYTFDVNAEVVEAPEDHQLGNLIKLDKYESLNIEEKFKQKGVDYMFTLDSDIITLQKNLDEFIPLYKIALASYLAGDWQKAYDEFEQCLEVLASDGPSKVLFEYLRMFNYESPATWNGYRNLDEDIKVIETPEQEQNNEDQPIYEENSEVSST